MPKRKYAIDINEAQRLLISWEGGLYYRQSDISVFLDGNLIGLIPAHVDLKQGQEFVLPDTSLLSVKLENSKLRVFRNGQDLALIERLLNNFRVGWFVLATIGILDVAGGIVGLVKPENHGFTTALLIMCGPLFLGLSLWARHRSKMAFILGTVLCVIEMILLVGWEKLDLWATVPGQYPHTNRLIWIGAVRSIDYGELQKKQEPVI
jgi:hypothetical protein